MYVCMRMRACVCVCVYICMNVSVWIYFGMMFNHGCMYASLCVGMYICRLYARALYVILCLIMLSALPHFHVRTHICFDSIEEGNGFRVKVKGMKWRFRMLVGDLVLRLVAEEGE